MDFYVNITWQILKRFAGVFRWAQTMKLGRVRRPHHLQH